MIRLHEVETLTNQMSKDETRKENQSHKGIQKNEGENKK